MNRTESQMSEEDIRDQIKKVEHYKWIAQTHSSYEVMFKMVWNLVSSVCTFFVNLIWKRKVDEPKEPQITKVESNSIKQT